MSTEAPVTASPGTTPPVTASHGTAHAKTWSVELSPNGSRSRLTIFTEDRDTIIQQLEKSSGLKYIWKEEEGLFEVKESADNLKDVLVKNGWIQESPNSRKFTKV